MGISSYANANHEVNLLFLSTHKQYGLNDWIVPVLQSYPRGTFTMEKQDARLEPFAPEFNHLHRWSLNINKQQSVGKQHSGNLSLKRCIDLIQKPEAKAGTFTKKPKDAVLEPFAPEFDHLKRWPLKIDEQQSVGGQHSGNLSISV
jgi:hypothetical protein